MSGGPSLDSGHRKLASGGSTALALLILSAWAPMPGYGRQPFSPAHLLYLERLTKRTWAPAFLPPQPRRPLWLGPITCGKNSAPARQRWTQRDAPEMQRREGNPKPSQDYGAEAPTSASRVVIGARVRLKDSGLLGTVVGKKGGGWWSVDLLHPDDSGQENPVSTRLVNIQPLGAAYASSDQGALLADAVTTAGNSRKKKANGEPDEVQSASSGVQGAGLTTDVQTVDSPIKLKADDGSKVGASAAAESGDVHHHIRIHTLDTSELPHGAVREWILFSDLHVSTRTLKVCLEVLDRVHEEAMKRDSCGILFLGDFWHVRGTLKVELLVPVMRKLNTWRRPLIMIPGNHDQVTLGGGVHSLTPLQFAFPSSKQVVVISEPTVALGALWIPHLRNNSVVEEVLGSRECQEAGAIFCHLNTMGAHMNDGMSSRQGLPLSVFPKDKVAYSGHFHKPHAVGNGTIRYIGSPYQISLSEAGQEKSLLVLDGTTWDQKEVIPIQLGRRFFRVRGEDEELPKPEEVSVGDRVVWSGVKDAGSEKVLTRAARLREANIDVEIREAPKSIFVAPAPDSVGNGTGVGGAPQDSSHLAPEALLKAYLAWEREGGRAVDEEVEAAGLKLVRECGQQSGNPGVLAAEAAQVREHTSLVLHQVRLKNFGPFQKETVYPLNGRGVVLLRGNNMDDPGADSNGAGKTTLAMSALWALAGNFDTRPVSDGRVTDVVFDGLGAGFSAGAVGAAGECEGEADNINVNINGGASDSVNGNVSGTKRRPVVAEVSVEGMLNGKPLEVKRRKGQRTNQLFLKHSGKDLTGQVVRDTQAVLEGLGVSPRLLTRAVFQGQHHMHGLLESTDAHLKEELAVLVPMDMWQYLASRSRETTRKCQEERATLQAQIMLREEDLIRFTKEEAAAREELEKMDRDIKLAQKVAGNTGSNKMPRVRATKKNKNAVSGTTDEAADKGGGGANNLDGKDRDMDRQLGNAGQDVAPGPGLGVEEWKKELQRVAEEAFAADCGLAKMKQDFSEAVEKVSHSKISLMGDLKASSERELFSQRNLGAEEHQTLSLEEGLPLLHKKEQELVKKGLKLVDKLKLQSAGKKRQGDRQGDQSSFSEANNGENSGNAHRSTAVDKRTRRRTSSSSISSSIGSGPGVRSVFDIFFDSGPALEPGSELGLGLGLESGVAVDVSSLLENTRAEVEEAWRKVAEAEAQLAYSTETAKKHRQAAQVGEVRSRCPLWMPRLEFFLHFF
ncbi:unnamed protein product [Discosporangium mesarthrocarpum]